MEENISRRGFIAAGVVGVGLVGVGGFGAITQQASAAYVRPPGTESNVNLVASCNRCQRCLQVCPVDIITPAPFGSNVVAYGTPILAFDKGHCNFCMECVEVCPTGALSYGGVRERDLGVAVVVKDACVAWDWMGCTVCKDECPVEGAITLDDQNRPVVHAEYCDGCGKCEQVCPSSSLRAYNVDVASKGIVVVSRESEVALLDDAVSTETLEAGCLIGVSQENALSPHTLGVHPDGDDNVRVAGE